MHGPFYLKQVSIHIVIPALKYCYLIWGHNSYSGNHCDITSVTFLDDWEILVLVFFFYLWFSRDYVLRKFCLMPKTSQMASYSNTVSERNTSKAQLYEVPLKVFHLCIYIHSFFPYFTCFYPSSAQFCFLFIHRPQTPKKKVFWKMKLSTLFWSLPGCIFFHVYEVGKDLVKIVLLSPSVDS